MDLGARLESVFSLVRRGSVVYDIGSDHGYLPASLILREICPRAVVTDINRGPLERAVRTFRENGVSDRAEFFLTGGLSRLSIPSDTSVDICICGMGGELISSILDDALKDGLICANADIHFILQPMSRPWEMRRYLWNNGFETDESKFVREGDKLYSVISAFYTGRTSAYTEAELYIGKRPERSADADTLLYFEKTAKSLKKKRDGKKLGGDETKYEDEVIGEILKEIEFLKKIFETRSNSNENK